MESARAEARPRIGLLGNPSDGYGGRVLGFTFEEFRARVEARRSGRDIELVGPDGAWRGTREELARDLTARELPGGPALLGAALLQRPASTGGISLRFESDIPRQVGLSGSSAIVVAALRALDALAQRTCSPFDLAEDALRAETEVLGVTAGPQDRVLQSHEGLLAMEFAPPRRPEGYRRLDVELLPELWLAYDPEPGTSSGVPHADVRARHARGEAAVVQAIERFAELALEGERALVARDHGRLADLLDESYDLRASIWPLSDLDRRMVALAREHRAAASLCGSGGAVVVLPRPETELASLRSGWRGAGVTSLRPTPGAPPRP